VVVPGFCTNETFIHRASSRGMDAEDKTHYDPWLRLTWLKIPLPALSECPPLFQKWANKSIILEVLKK
jgi:hypothetical protein